MPSDKALTEVYVLLLRDVTTFLARLDLAGIIGSDDEYDMEAGQIVRRVLREATGAGDVQRIASEVFAEYLGEHSGRLPAIGEEIWKLAVRRRRESGLPPAEPLGPVG